MPNWENKLRFADEQEYYLTSECLLKLASNAGRLFESSRKTATFEDGTSELRAEWQKSPI